jgi:hypothetical protein
MSGVSVMKVCRKLEEDNKNYNLNVVGVQEIRWETVILAIGV